MEEVDSNEVYKVSKEYKYIQVEVSAASLDRLAGLVSAVSSSDDRSLSEVHIDLDDYCDIGEEDVLVERIQTEHNQVNMIVFYERG